MIEVVACDQAVENWRARQGDAEGTREQRVRITLVDVQAARNFCTIAFDSRELGQSVIEKVGRYHRPRHAVQKERLGGESAIALAQQDRHGLIAVGDRQILMSTESESAGHDLKWPGAGIDLASQTKQAATLAEQNLYGIGLIVDHRQIRPAIL